MSESDQPRMSLLGAGFRRLWAEKEIAEGRMITAAALAREASAPGAPVQGGTPWSIILGRDNYSPAELARLLSYFEVTLEQVELIGDSKPAYSILSDAVCAWEHGKLGNADDGIMG